MSSWIHFPQPSSSRWRWIKHWEFNSESAKCQFHRDGETHPAPIQWNSAIKLLAKFSFFKLFPCGNTTYAVYPQWSVKGHWQPVKATLRFVATFFLAICSSRIRCSLQLLLNYSLIAKSDSSIPKRWNPKVNLLVGDFADSQRARRVKIIPLRSVSMWSASVIIARLLAT